ncbi:4'-phosphopantetheinyl transferase superfamily protein [Streptomyces sp. NPDC089919]|uniref:4'-phosphopantetheinyl transferase family protein n=1 Tax=Streptomyces sp. NPDC089919 TaxID=3155188 RepID=UPI003447D2D8
MDGARHGPPAGEVHVWATPAVREDQQGALGRCLALLSPQEGERWRRIVPEHRALYASAHAALRVLTAAYAGVRSDEVRFVAGRFGKPYVAGHPALRVSLSHTAGLSLVAVSRDGPIGVDVERLHPLESPAALQDMVLSRWEAARWPARHPPGEPGRLLTHWACKEAVLKAIGCGLTGDLATVEVDPGERRSGPVPLRGLPAGSGRRAWALHLLDLGPGRRDYRAAVAVAGGGRRVRLSWLPPDALPAAPRPHRPPPAGPPARADQPGPPTRPPTPTGTGTRTGTRTGAAMRTGEGP